MTENEDEKLASMMKSLPQQPLPPGFMQRLERRRRAEDAAAKPATQYLLPFPARVAAFALSSLIVSLVVYDKVKVMFPVSSMVSGAAAQEHLPSTALSEADVEQARAAGKGRRLLRAGGEPIDTMAAKLAKAEAAPAAASQPSNEELQAGLEHQKRAMKMRAIIAPPPPEVQAVLKLKAGIDAQMLKTSPPAPELGSASSPALLAQSDAPAPKPLPMSNGAPVAAANLAAAAAPAAPAEAEGVVLASVEDRQKAWNDHGLHAAPPTVNFEHNVVALVVAPDLRTAVEIIGVSTRADRVVVSYRLFPRMAEVASVARSGSNLVRAYQFRVIPKTSKPVVFSLVN